MGTALALSESETNIAKKASSYGMAAEQVDGMNVVDVEVASSKAVEQIRQTNKPYFLECQSYRFRGHSSFDGQLYRDKAEVKLWQEKGPVIRLITWLKENNRLEYEELNNIEAEIKAEIQAAIDFAEHGQWESISDLAKDVYSPAVSPTNINKVTNKSQGGQS
jgi:TPP-dependent pyruvate/acetoin dehydrogenase alpha subunit